MTYQSLLAPILSFLHCETPDAWIDAARRPENLQLLLTDHLVCELKAAQTGMWLIRRYVADKETATRCWRCCALRGVSARGAGRAGHAVPPGPVHPQDPAENGSAYGQDLADRMVLLIKEELHHFSQVLEIMQARGIPYRKITASRYAKGMIRGSAPTIRQR